MFTGIVQARGTVRSIRHEPPIVRLALDAADLPRPVELGASICVSGVCLTVTAADERALCFDVIPETLARTTLGLLRPGSQVNLEPSLRAGDRMDGHIVQGHIDGTALVCEVAIDPAGHVVRFEAGTDLMAYVIPKGSVAIDGVSLTIASVQADTFTVALIPTTLAVTTLGTLKIGDRVNVETDILARTVVTTLERWRERGEERGGIRPLTREQVAARLESPLTVESLRENGWQP